MAKRIDTQQLSSDIRISVNRLARRLRAEKADGALSDGQTAVLGVLSVRGGQTLSELAEFEGVTPPSMNRTVNALVDAGYAAREPSTEDRRKAVIELTPAGTEVVRETRRRRDAWLYPRLARLTPEQRATLAGAAPILRSLTG